MIQSTIGVRVTTVESEHGSVELVAVSAERPMDVRLFLNQQDTPGQTWQMVRMGRCCFQNRLPVGWEFPCRVGQLHYLPLKVGIHFPSQAFTRITRRRAGRFRMGLDVYQRLWSDDQLNGLVLFMAPHSDIDIITSNLRSQLTDFPAIQVNPSGALRQDALVVFDRTFAITAAMQLVTTLVAFIGVLSSLLAVQLEKAREIGILRALGLNLAEMRRLTLWETGLLGASAGLLAPTCWLYPGLDPDFCDQSTFLWLDVTNAGRSNALHPGIPAISGGCSSSCFVPSMAI